MDHRWYKGFRTAADKEAREKQLQSFRPAFNELIDFLEEHIKRKPAVRDYETTNWVERQIAVNEYNQALDDLIKLIKEK